MCLKPIIGGVREVVIRAPLRFAEAPTADRMHVSRCIIGHYRWPDYFVNVHEQSPCVTLSPCASLRGNSAKGLSRSAARCFAALSMTGLDLAVAAELSRAFEPCLSSNIRNHKLQLDKLSLLPSLLSRAMSPYQQTEGMIHDEIRLRNRPAQMHRLPRLHRGLQGRARRTHRSVPHLGEVHRKRRVP